VRERQQARDVVETYRVGSAAGHWSTAWRETAPGCVSNRERPSRVPIRVRSPAHGSVDESRSSYGSPRRALAAVRTACSCPRFPILWRGLSGSRQSRRGTGSRRAHRAQPKRTALHSTTTHPLVWKVITARHGRASALGRRDGIARKRALASVFRNFGVEPATRVSVYLPIVEW